MINNILTGVSILLIVVVLFVMYQRAKLKTVDILEDDFSTIDKIVEAVKVEMVEIVKEDYTLGLSDAEFNSLYKRKARIKDALKNSVHGIDSAKVIVIELIRSFIDQNVPKDRIAELLGVSDGMQPSNHVMFEILMYRFKKKHGKQALTHMIKEYDLARERKAYMAESDNDSSYYVTEDDLHDIYENEQIILTTDEQVDILAILVYQLYKGFGILDTLREMDINGFNCGTSGSINAGVKKHREGGMKATNSVWLYFQGKYIHLRFMSFGSEDELKRIILLLVRYNSPGPLTAKRGYLVNTMYDKSRILALRPPASEYWAIFVRKFTISDPSPQALIVKPHVIRGDLPIKLIEFMMRGQVTTAVTGRQGSGKTTLMASIMRYIDPRYTLRILEMAPELYLRELYPTRNILSVQETETTSAEDLQDALKKSDAAVSVAGEVATDSVAARMIQMGMTASLFTIFSHHANTGKDLVLTLRNSLVNAGGFSNMSTAERQVTEVVKMDIHLDYTPDGERYIERITEIIPLDENIPYEEYDENDPHSMNRITADYYNRRTDRVSFFTRDILRYDLKTKTYYAVNRISPELEKKIRNNLGELQFEYDKFMFSEWGRRSFDSEGLDDDVMRSVVTYYGDKLKESQLNTALLETGVTLEEDIDDTSLEVVQDIIKEDVKVEVTTGLEIDVDTEETDLPDIDDLSNDEIIFDFFEGGVNV